jgi:hypothetical protein
MARVAVDDAPWLCEDRYRRIAEPVLHFIDEAARQQSNRAGAQTNIKDPRTGWSVARLGTDRFTPAYRVELVIYPGGANASTRWDSIARCKPIRFGRVAQAERLGLPHSVHDLYYAAAIGLYLLKP